MLSTIQLLTDPLATLALAAASSAGAVTALKQEVAKQVGATC